MSITRQEPGSARLVHISEADALLGKAAHYGGETAAPLKPLPEPADHDRYRVRRQTHAGCLIGEYRLVA